MQLPATDLGAVVASNEHAAASVYWAPCLGLPPVAIACPARYFGAQLLAGLASLLGLLFAEGVR